MMQIVETCTHYSESAFSTLLGSPKVPLAMKEHVTQILASAACHTRLDLLMGWLLDRLNQQQHNLSAAESSSEYKSWLLSLLQEVTFYFVFSSSLTGPPHSSFVPFLCEDDPSCTDRSLYATSTTRMYAVDHEQFDPIS
jgi:hypothetical protein